MSVLNQHRHIHLNIIAWLAAFWSYAVNKSILWAIFHFFCGSAYIAYRIVFHTTLLPR